jgi:hypothetical protein
MCPWKVQLPGDCRPEITINTIKWRTLQVCYGTHDTSPASTPRPGNSRNERRYLLRGRQVRETVGVILRHLDPGELRWLSTQILQAPHYHIVRSAAATTRYGFMTRPLAARTTAQEHEGLLTNRRVLDVDVLRQSLSA